MRRPALFAADVLLTSLRFAVMVALTLTAGCQSSFVRKTSDTSVPAAIKPRWLTPAEVKAFDNDEVKAQQVKELDFFVLWTAQASDDAERERHLAGAVLLTKYYLHQLFYPVDLNKTDHPADDPDFYSTLVAFERRAKLIVDGKFTVAEFDKLAYLAQIENEMEISSVFKFVSVTSVLASAEGTWTLQGDIIASPVNRTQIRCWRPEQSCTVFTADIMLPREDQPAGARSAVLVSDVQYYEVTRWTASEVQARTKSDCRQTILTINGTTKQVYEVTTDLTKEGCPLLGPMDKPKVATLEDGSEVIRGAYETRKAPAHAASNSPMQRLRELMGTDSTEKQKSK